MKDNRKDKKDENEEVSDSDQETKRNIDKESQKKKEGNKEKSKGNAGNSSQEGKSAFDKKNSTGNKTDKEHILELEKKIAELMKLINEKGKEITPPTSAEVIIEHKEKQELEAKLYDKLHEAAANKGPSMTVQTFKFEKPSEFSSSLSIKFINKIPTLFSIAESGEPSVDRMMIRP